MSGLSWAPAAVFAALPALLVWTYLRRPSEGPLNLAWAIYAIAMTVAEALAGNTGWALFNAGLTGLYLCWWWRNRRRRKLAERVLGVVRNVGHKLTVVNIPVEVRR